MALVVQEDKTRKLIDKAKNCIIDQSCDTCPFNRRMYCYISLMGALTDRLEQSHKILEIITHHEDLCEVCKHSHDDGTCDVVGMCTFELRRDLYDNT